MDESKKFCRLCLTTSVVYYSLLKDNGREMVMSLTGVLITDDFPNTIFACVKCWCDLKLAFSIQQRFVDSEQKFQMDAFESVNDTLKLHDIEKAPVDKKKKAFSIGEFEEPHIKDEVIEYEHEIENTLSDDDIQYDEMIVIETEEEASALDTILNPVTNIIDCTICGMKCEGESGLLSHTNSHYNDEQVCETCLRSYPSITAYRAHIESSHPENADKIYNCGICPMTFRYKPLYDIHLGTVHKETAKRKKISRDISKYYIDGDTLKCHECNKVCRDKKAFQAHVKGHERRECPICGARITKVNIAKHIENHQVNPVICDICGITAKNRDSLRGHIYYTHSKKQLKCDYCSRIFKKLYTYKMHIKKEHIGERSFTCDTCGKQFFTRYQLSTHIKRTHLKVRDHICEFCGKGFSSRFSMRTHKRQHTNEAPYKCHVCGVGFRQNVSLRSHLKSKHNILEDQTAECPICHKMFKDDWALKTHTRSVHD